MIGKTCQPGFTGSYLDRTDEDRPKDDVIAAFRASPDARLMVLDALDPVVDAEGGLLWLPMRYFADREAIYLGLDDGAPRFVITGDAGEIGGKRVPALQAISGLRPGEAAIYACARSLTDWHQRHQFCANCGTRTQMIRCGWARQCSRCGAEHFPRTDPVVIMLATHKGRALLGRQPHFPPRVFSALAGFVEVGESIEEAVARELKEEAGVKVVSVRYVASQPWPFPSSLMIGCFAEVEDDTINLDTQELEHAFWASREEVAEALKGTGGFGVAPQFAIAHTLLLRWVAED